MEKLPRPLLLTICLVLAILPLAAFSALAKPTSNPQPTFTQSKSPTADIFVTTTTDELNTDGDCSLREAIQAANTDTPVDLCGTGSGADAIHIPPGIYSFTLPTTGEDANQDGDLDISQSVDINGAGADVTIINGSDIDRIFHVTTSGINVVITDLSITNGTAFPGTGNGGGIFSSGSLVLGWVDVSYNNAPRAGGIATDATGSLNIQNSSIHHNTAPYTGSGTGVAGGIEHFGPSMMVINSTVSDNTSGYINPTGNLRDSNPSGNTQIIFSTISNNTQGGAFTSGGTYVLAGSIIANNAGQNCSPGTFTSGDFNIVSNAECGLIGANDLTNTDPLLEPLQYAGGPTQSRALQPGSPALDRMLMGVNGCSTTYTYDQRGFIRPDSTMCDAGAVEGTVASSNNPPVANNDSYATPENTILQIPGSLGLVGYWRLDEGSGAVAADSSGLGNDGALVGPPTWDGGITAPLNFGNPFALDFDGTGSDYVSVLYHSSLDAANELTLSAWVNLRNVTADAKIVGKANPSADFGYVLGVANGMIYPEIWDSLNAHYGLQAGTILTDTWTHLAVTWQSGGDLIAYMNGIEVDRIAASANPVAASTTPLIIGAAPWNPVTHLTNGRIDDVRVYTRALNPNEILAMADAGVLANDTDPDSDPLTSILLAPPTNGNLLAFDPDGAFEYSPALNFTGVDTFTYMTSDGTLTDTATVIITVFPAGNNPPIAVSDVYTIPEDSTIYLTPLGGMLNNDSDPDGDSITVTQVASPTNGTLLYFNPDGSFAYQPNQDYYGVDSFDYVITDGFFTDTAIVTMTITSVNDPAVANDDAYTTTQDIPVSVSAPGILVNDSDVELDPLTAYLFVPPVTGTLQFNSDGSFDYTPPLGYTGVVTFAYAASDNQGLAVQFDGVDSYIDLGDSFESFGDFSVEAWIYRDFATGAFEEIFSKDAISSFAIDNLGHLHFNLGDGAVWGTGMSSVAPIPLNQWVHVAATWNSVTGEANLYINGQWDSTSTNSILVGNNAAVRGIGQKPAFDTSTFPGIIEEVRVWNTARTGAEIRANMTGQLIPGEPGLIGYYKLDEGSGLLTVDSAGTINGTLTDFPAGAEWVNSPHPFSNLATVALNILPAGVGPDLTIPTLIASPNDVCQGQFFALIFAVANQGNVDAGAHQVFIYDDPVPTGFSNQTFTANILSALAGQTRYFSLSANSFITGTRYIKAFADGTHVITETNELNNGAVIPINVQPDPAPTGSILINGGAISSPLPNLTLTLSAVDTGNCATSPASMRFAYDGLTLPWEPYTTTKNIIVSTTGVVTVSVQYRDEHNNISPWINATIIIGDVQRIFLPVILR